MSFACELRVVLSMIVSNTVRVQHGGSLAGRCFEGKAAWRDEKASQEDAGISLHPRVHNGLRSLLATRCYFVELLW